MCFSKKLREKIVFIFIEIFTVSDALFCCMYNSGWPFSYFVVVVQPLKRCCFPGFWWGFFGYSDYWGFEYNTSQYIKCFLLIHLFFIAVWLICLDWLFYIFIPCGIFFVQFSTSGTPIPPFVRSFDVVPTGLIYIFFTVFVPIIPSLNTIFSFIFLQIHGNFPLPFLFCC